MRGSTVCVSVVDVVGVEVTVNTFYPHTLSSPRP